MVEATPEVSTTPTDMIPPPPVQEAVAPEVVEAPWTPWWESFIAFDTETTGLYDDARVIDVAAVRFEKGKIVDHYWSLINPGDEVNWDDPGVQKAMAVNQLTREELKDAPSFEQVFAPLMAAFAQSPIWVAHNKAFDLRMIKAERMRLQQKLGKDLADQVPKPAVVICTMLVDRILNPTKHHIKRNLASVCERRGVMPDSAHRALVDAEACGKVLWQMVETEPRLRSASIAQLNAGMNKEKIAHEATCGRFWKKP